MISDKLCAELIEIPKNFIPAKDVDDLTQEVLMQLLDMPGKKLQRLIKKGEIHKYFNRMCKLNYLNDEIFENNNTTIHTGRYTSI